MLDGVLEGVHAVKWGDVVIDFHTNDY